jgi:hypothetical protein
MDMTLPPPVNRWLERLDAPAEPFTTAVIEGSARFRREGKGFWLPIEAVMWHELGRHHVVDLRVGIGPVTFVRGLDGYVDGSGFSRISHTLDIGPEVDQASLLFMWSEAILFPAAWADHEDVDWAPLDDDTAAVTFTAPDAPVPAEVAFDPDSGMPVRFSAARFKGVGAAKVEWIVDYGPWQPTEDGALLPSSATVTWADEPGPWFRMQLRRANPGADVSAALARGRRLQAEIAADPTRRAPGPTHRSSGPKRGA